MREIQPIKSSVLEKLSEGATDFARQSRADSTLKGYQSDWRGFENFCRLHGLSVLPAQPTTIALFITLLAATHRPSTIQRKLAAISVAHKSANFDSPLSSEIVRSTMSGIRRAKGMSKRQASPLRVRHLREGISLMRVDSKGARDKALILIAFAGAMRRSEIVSLDIEQTTFSSDGVVFNLSKSKTDQEGHGVRIAIKVGNRSDTCPVHALRIWLEMANISEGAIFRSVKKGGQVSAARLSDKSVATVFKDFAILIGLDPKMYSGHSARAGAVTEGFAVGLAQAVIAKHSRHRSNSIADYLREATLFDQNLSGLIGL